MGIGVGTLGGLVGVGGPAIAVPQIIGAVVGWRVAHLMDPDRLKVLLGVVLVYLGPVLAF